MKRNLGCVVALEDGVFVARCLDVDVAIDGPTGRDAVASLREALALYFEDGEHATAVVNLRQG